MEELSMYCCANVNINEVLGGNGRKPLLTQTTLQHLMMDFGRVFMCFPGPPGKKTKTYWSLGLEEMIKWLHNINMIIKMPAKQDYAYETALRDAIAGLQVQVE
jgi:hypothetical protein